MDEGIEQIIALSGDPHIARTQLERFEAAYHEAAGVPFEWASENALALARLFGNSSVLAERLIANPHWAEKLIRSPFLDARKPAQTIGRELETLIDDSPPHGDEQAFMRALRFFRYREMMRIVVRDLAPNPDERDVLAEWSDVADAVLGAAWERAFAMTAAQYGPPRCPAPNGRETPCTGAVIALGKLGGRELNLSSDVDLITIYASDEGGARHGGADITNHEFFVKQTALFTKLVSGQTEHGFAFRVDHELRPEGPQGPLSNALDAAERYYEYFGHDWERQALIRARFVAGDAKLGERFQQAVAPFVYRRALSLSDLAHMRRMKEAMERAAKKSSEVYDVKLGVGGIREIEFLTQAICLLFGGFMKDVRMGNTFDAIDALADAALIHPFGAKRLKSAYAFLRRLENMIQVENDLQQHKLPTGTASLAALARKMGFYDSDPSLAAQRMQGELERHRSGAHRLFTALFEADYERLELMDAIRDNAARAADEEEEIESLAWFRKQEVRRIRQRDLAGSMELTRILYRLTLTAEAVLSCTLEMAARHLEKRFGVPRLPDGSRAGFAVVGLGSLGAGELDYRSDLDLCFLYAGAGMTDGKTRISNVEYFTKLAQRIISTLSLHGRYGHAYKVDSELRPSGRSGTLVATLDSFTSYHRGEAQIWERLSLMKARPITGDGDFVKAVDEAIRELAFSLPPPPKDAICAEMSRLRDKTISERAATRPEVLNIKIGRGGLADIESIVQLHQLLGAQAQRELRCQNTFEVLAALGELDMMEASENAALMEHFTFLRRLLSRLRLTIERSTDEIRTDAWYMDQLAFHLKLPSGRELALDIERRMAEIADIFEMEIG